MLASLADVILSQLASENVFGQVPIFGTLYRACRVTLPNGIASRLIWSID